jgi:hypothetical protein
MRLRMMSVVVLVFATTVGVRSASAVCSNATLQGVYRYFHGRQRGRHPSGTDIIVGQFTSDAKGDLSGGSWTLAVSGGAVSTGTFSGKYSIAINCTGALTFKNQDNGKNIPAHFNIALDNGNQGFR